MFNVIYDEITKKDCLVLFVFPKPVSSFTLLLVVDISGPEQE